MYSSTVAGFTDFLFHGESFLKKPGYSDYHGFYIISALKQNGLFQYYCDPICQLAQKDSGRDFRTVNTFMKYITSEFSSILYRLTEPGYNWFPWRQLDAPDSQQTVNIADACL